MIMWGSNNCNQNLFLFLNQSFLLQCSYPYNCHACNKEKHPFIVCCENGQPTLVGTSAHYVTPLMLSMCYTVIVNRNFCEDLVLLLISPAGVVVSFGTLCMQNKVPIKRMSSGKGHYSLQVLFKKSRYQTHLMLPAKTSVMTEEEICLCI